MRLSKGYSSTRLSFNRRLVQASASITREQNAIHSLAEIDISIPRRLREEYRLTAGVKLSMTAYIVHCLAKTLKDFPEFNSFISGRRLVRMDELTISVLVERDLNGEAVPEPVAIQEAQEKSLRQIHDEIRAVQARKDEKIGELTGARWVNCRNPLV